MKIRNNLLAIKEVISSIHLSDDDIIEMTSKHSLLHIFDDVEDFRMVNKTAYKLSDLLLLIFLTVIRSQSNSFMDIAVHIHYDQEFFIKLGLIQEGRFPSHDTIRIVMSYIESSVIEDVLVNRIHCLLEELEKSISKNSMKHISIDGKEIRGTGRKPDTKKPTKNIQILNVYDNTNSVCFKTETISNKTNEIPVAQEILSNYALNKTIVTADALHTQRKTCQIIADRKGYYVFPVKDNQPLLLEEIKAKFSNKKNKKEVYNTEKRDFEIYYVNKQFDVDGFKGMKDFIKMTSKVRKKNIVMYFITNLKDDELMIQAIEDRWQIENDLHREKDVYLNEDEIRFTNKNAVNSMAIMNNVVVAFARIIMAFNPEMRLKEAKYYLKYQTSKAINSILLTLNSDETMKQLKEQMKKKANK